MVDVLQAIGNVNAWRKGDKRAPHKPLLMLFALSQLQRGITVNPFTVVDEKLSKLLEDYGPPNPTKATYPFLRLANDGIWTVQASEPLKTTQDYGKGKLIQVQASGSFIPEVQDSLKDPTVFTKAVEFLLHENFPESLHEDILNALGMELEFDYTEHKRKRRDPEFRQRILEAYERKCAVCGFQIRRDDQVVGVEAAHIKWHQAGGPDIEQNGVAMCTMHHKLFDYGLFAIDESLKIRVSTKANGGFGLQEWLLRFHDQGLHLPVKRTYYPEREFIHWQVNEVFKGTYRD